MVAAASVRVSVLLVPLPVIFIAVRLVAEVMEPAASAWPLVLLSVTVVNAFAV